jgi:putative spermidine/putrescine transport system ATP-binding protein
VDHPLMAGEDQTAPGGGIEIQALVKRYEGTAVVDNISATVAPGEFFSLLGPSGSGKTTTLMMLAGFEAPDSGGIAVGGRNVVDLSPQQRGFGMVFQNYAIFPHLNVWENVAFSLKVRRLPADEIRRRVAWALELVRLGAFGQRSSRQLSGGQLQRVALARAIVFHPRIVLMDEPLGALDKNLRYEMQTEIKEIQRRLGMTVVYVTHDQEEAMNMSDRLAIMNKGRIDQIAAPSEIYERPCNTFVARFLGQANLIAGSVDAAAGGLTSLRLEDGTLLRGTAGVPLSRGAPASMFVRPEKVAIVPGSDATQASASQNRLTARLRRVSFLGNIVRYTFDALRASEISVDLQNVGAVPQLETGAEVTLGWACADTQVLGDVA